MIEFRAKRALVALPILLALSSGSMAASIPDTVGGIARTGGDSITQAQPPHLDVDTSVDDDSLSTPQDASADATLAAVDDRQVECVAKVIVHEAGREPHDGQVAVAQVIRARMKRSGADDACAVIRKPGQFFNVDAYSPPHDARWDNAVEIARATLAGEGDDVAPGAIFFHAASSRGAWVSQRTRVAQIGGQVFFR